MTTSSVPNPVIANLQTLRLASDLFMGACHFAGVTLENTDAKPGLHPTNIGGFAHIHISAANLDRLTAAIWEGM